MNLPLAQSLAESFLTSHGLAAKGWEVRFTSLKRNFGVCNRPLRRISISRQLTLASEPEALEATMLEQVRIAQLEKWDRNYFEKGIDRSQLVDVESKSGNVNVVEKETQDKGDGWKVTKIFPLTGPKVIELKENTNKMALMLIKKGNLPVPARGRGAGSLSVAVRENGQIGFSSLAGKAFENYTHCAIQWNDDERTMIFTPCTTKKLPKGVAEGDLFPVGASKDGKQRFISAATLFREDAIAYDYKYAGTQSFEAVIDQGKVSFTLPEKMEPKPKQIRTKKVKTATASASTTASNEPVLQEA